ncbi:MAG: exodeoxyribonuclease VII small subunit [Bifidobacteriaceae bacterium]|jgi:exodeoxyribonuclease VII small subunit|nr:exodeoxyribonuclease VII small subunit [Bifidobacteriaceae bacterium]
MPSPPPQSEAGARALTYEQARAGLISVIQTLEAGAETLDESLSLWEKGEAMANRCQDLLDAARARLGAAQSSPNPPVDDDGPNTNGGPPA